MMDLAVIVLIVLVVWVVASFAAAALWSAIARANK
jgi:hypothetical protein